MTENLVVTTTKTTTDFCYHAPAELPVRSTIVGKLFPDGTICIAASRCGKRDSFCKKTGRRIALGRLHKGKCIASTTAVSDESPMKAFLAVAKATVEYLVFNAKPVTA